MTALELETMKALGFVKHVTCCKTCKYCVKTYVDQIGDEGWTNYKCGFSNMCKFEVYNDSVCSEHELKTTK